MFASTFKCSRLSHYLQGWHSVWVHLLASPFPIQLHNGGPWRTEKNCPSTCSLPPTWEMQIKWQTPNFSLVQTWLLQPIASEPHDERYSLSTLSLTLPFKQINTSVKDTKNLISSFFYFHIWNPVASWLQSCLWIQDE